MLHYEPCFLNCVYDLKFERHTKMIASDENADREIV